MGGRFLEASPLISVTRKVDRVVSTRAPASGARGANGARARTRTSESGHICRELSAELHAAQGKALDPTPRYLVDLNRPRTT